MDVHRMCMTVYLRFIEVLEMEQHISGSGVVVLLENGRGKVDGIKGAAKSPKRAPRAAHRSKQGAR